MFHEAVPPFRPAAFVCAVVPPCFELDFVLPLPDILRPGWTPGRCPPRPGPKPGLLRGARGYDQRRVRVSVAPLEDADRAGGAILVMEEVGQAAS